MSKTCNGLAGVIMTICQAVTGLGGLYVSHCPLVGILLFVD